VSAPALADDIHPNVVPPPRYDYPYEGKLYELVVGQQGVRTMCPDTNFNLGFALGCTKKLPPSFEAPLGTCYLYLAYDREMTRVGHPPSIVRRDEITHCNGWSADHEGALPLYDWGVVEEKPQPAKARPRSLSEILFGR